MQGWSLNSSQGPKAGFLQDSPEEWRDRILCPPIDPHLSIPKSNIHETSCSRNTMLRVSQTFYAAWHPLHYIHAVSLLLWWLSHSWLLTKTLCKFHHQMLFFLWKSSKPTLGRSPFWFLLYSVNTGVDAMQHWNYWLLEYFPNRSKCN